MPTGALHKLLLTSAPQQQLCTGEERFRMADANASLVGAAHLCWVPGSLSQEQNRYQRSLTAVLKSRCGQEKNRP